jgi:GNAT superfamily N-acetyltransferase
VIRRATPADAAAVAGVGHRGWTVGYAAFVPRSQVAAGPDPREWAAKLGSDHYTTLVWEGDEGIAGFVSFGATEPVDEQPDGTGIVLALYVDERAQGTGVGGALLDAACDELRARGMHRAVLWTFAENARARAFYEHRGWVAEPASLQPHDVVGADELRYRRTL